MADMNRTTKGALLGAGVGLLTGNGVNGVLKGAAVGAGVGAVTEKGRDGKNARKGAKVGAAVGAVTGVLTGNGLEGAIKGAVIGGTGGAILGNDSNLLIVFYVQIMPDDFVMQLHRF